MKTIGLSLVIAAALVSTPAHAEDKSTEIDKIFSWATPTTPGCAVAASLHGKLVVNRAYGSADLERDVPISPVSIFDAGSLTKQFVAAATLLLVEDGRLSLSEDIRRYIPEMNDTGHKVTVDHLLTHTSGVRDWTGIAPLATGNPDALTIVLRQRGLNFAPGEEWSYSNSGYVLLKEIIARTGGMPFSEFTRRRLFEPIGMTSTTYSDDLRGIVRNRAVAYHKTGDRWRLAMLLDNDRGGGGALLSTARDLITWNEALTGGRLGAFVTAKLQEPAKLNNGRKLGYTRGLFLDTYRDAREIWHTGSAAGYKSWLGRYPEHGLSIAIMCNSGDDTNRTRFAHRIFDLYVPGTAAAGAAAKAPVAIDGVPEAPKVDLSGKPGLFFSERTGEPLRLIVDRGWLRVANGPPLAPLGSDRFRPLRPFLQFMSADAFELQMLPEDGFELRSMEGTTTRYHRARPHTPAEDELNAFAGRYESDEVGTVFQIEPRGDGLVMRLGRSPARSLELRLVDRDIFQQGMMTVRFHRDKTGKAVALHYSNPLVRGVKFTRVTDVKPGG
ncbi:MAG TPA: serine hydrolase [Bryobacteraceae bacterium]|nr:serine hydrolase [Bryobacteraceae bacterium]